jgi:hypothetical protein
LLKNKIKINLKKEHLKDSSVESAMGGLIMPRRQMKFPGVTSSQLIQKSKII